MEIYKSFNIKIKGQNYKVLLVDLINEDGNILGLTDSEEHIIKIKFSDRTSIDTISHELFHSYFHECGLKNNFGNEEDLIWWLGFNFEDVLKNVKLIIKKFKDKKVVKNE